MKNIFLITLVVLTISCKKKSDVEPEYKFSAENVKPIGDGYVQSSNGMVYKFDGKEFKELDEFPTSKTFYHNGEACMVSSGEFIMGNRSFSASIYITQGEIFYSDGYLYHNWPLIASNPTLTGIYLDVYKITEEGLKRESSTKIDKYIFGVVKLQDVPTLLFKTRESAKYFKNEIYSYSKLDVNFTQVKQYASNNNSIYFLMQSGSVVKVHNSEYSTIANKVDTIFSYEDNVYSIIDGVISKL